MGIRAPPPGPPTLPPVFPPLPSTTFLDLCFQLDSSVAANKTTFAQALQSSPLHPTHLSSSLAFTMPLVAMPKPSFISEESSSSSSSSPPALATKRRRVVIRRTGSSAAKRRLELEEGEAHTVVSASKRARLVVEEVAELLAGLGVEVLAA